LYVYRLATKRTDKNKLKKTRTWVFWDRQSGVHWYVLLFTDFVNYWTLVCHAQWSRLSTVLGAFINSTRWTTSCVPAVRNRNQCDLLPIYPTQYDRLSQQQLSLSFLLYFVAHQTILSQLHYIFSHLRSETLTYVRSLVKEYRS